jgi:hypothetical protein
MYRSTIVLPLVLLAIVSCSGDSKSPVSPTPSAGTTATSLAVTSAAPAGAGLQLTATVTLSDGTSRNVTTTSAWESSNPALATVSDAGLVTVVSGGDVDFRATYQSVAGTLRVSVVQTRYAISGRVSPVFPNQPGYLANVKVDVTSGPNAGAFTYTGPDGAFTIPGLSAGRLDLRVAIAGYSTWTLVGLNLAADEAINPTLFPMPPRNETGATATAQCNDATWTWTDTRDGACVGHGGVAWGMCPGPICDNIFAKSTK